MSDIVERLRALEAWIRHPTGEPYNMNTDLFDDAAAEITALRAENERLRAALESVDTWLDRWAVHVGRCEGGHRCTCGLIAIRYEVSAALDGQPAPGKEEA